MSPRTAILAFLMAIVAGGLVGAVHAVLAVRRDERRVGRASPDLVHCERERSTA
jgi:hypothetical protein